MWAEHPVLNVIEGRARGADRIAGSWASNRRSRGVGWVPFPADWKAYGKAAGPIRNRAMLRYLLQARGLGDEVRVMAFHQDIASSVGTKDMVQVAKAAGVPGVVIG